MSDYTITTDFGAKDSLPSGNAAKIIKGSEFTTEFTNIKTAIATKANTVSPTFTGNTALDGATTFGANGTSTFNGTVNFTKDVTFDTNTLFVDVSENRVGIGNVAPATALDVTGVITTDGLTSSAGIDVTGVITTDGLTSSAGIDITGTVTASGLTVDTNTLHVDATNNRVGIGTDSPATKLDVVATQDTVANILSNGSYAAKFSSSGSGDTGRTQGILLSGANANTRGVALLAEAQSDNNAHDFVIATSASTSTPTERLRIDSSGNVGIGTNSPAFKLDVAGNARASYFALRSNETAPSESAFIYRPATGVLGFGTGTTERMRIDSSGNVGIGTTSPANTLTVGDLEASALDQDGTVGIKCNANHKGIILQENSGAEQWSIGVGEAGSLKFYDSDSTTPAVTFEDISGNVGIGTTSPSAMLDVELGATGTIAEFRGGDSDILQIKNENDLMVFDTRNTTSGLAFQMQGAEHMRIDSSGNLLVGTTDTTPYDNTTGSGICWGGGTNQPNSIARESTATCLILNKTGTQAGSTGIQDFRYNGTSIGTIAISSTAVALNSTSDERLKENITDSTDAGSKVDSIQIRQFDWKADGSHQDYGVIAQELQTVAPEAVYQPEDSEDMMGVDYSKLVPMLIKEVQTLRSRVAELENV